MGHLWVGLLLVIFSAGAMAEWTNVAGSPVREEYFDAATRTWNWTGNKVKVWQMTDYKTVQDWKGQQFWSSKSLMEFDCKDKEFRVSSPIAYSGHMGEGSVLPFGSIPGPKWSPASPGSIIEFLLNIACAKK